MASMYQPLWRKLVKEHRITVEVTRYPEDTDTEMLKKFKRIRKALSNIKNNDIEFFSENPTARIETVLQDCATGILVIELRYMASFKLQLDD